MDRVLALARLPLGITELKTSALWCIAIWFRLRAIPVQSGKINK